MALPTGVRAERRPWSDSLIDETWPRSPQPAEAPGPPAPTVRSGHATPSIPYLQADPGSRSRKALLVGALAVAVLLAVTATVAAITLRSDGADTVTPVPGGPLASIDQVFAPVSGYSFEDALPSAVAGLRAQLDAQPATKAVTISADGRRVMQNGQTVAVVSAVLFQEQVGAAPDAETAFLAAARADLASPQDVTIAGQRAVSGQGPDGIRVLEVYKNRVGLVVGGPADMATLEQLTTKLLANIP